MKSTFTIPKLCKPANNIWYVYFRYEGKLKRYSLGINYIKDEKKREIEANALAKALHQKLKNNWNPNLPELQFTKPNYAFIDAIKFALDKKKPNLASKTISGYTGTLKFISEAITNIGLKAMPINEVKRAHIKVIMEEAAKINKWSNKAYNKHLNQLKAILSELIQWDVIDFNPAHQIKNLPTEEVEANIPATAKQHEKIKETLENHHPDFYKFIITIFHTGIRPAEILQIKLNMIDLQNQQIILPKEITKTKRKRIVPINNHLLKHLQTMLLLQYPSNYYLFGSHRTPGKGNIGNYADFIPGPTPIKRDTATKRWHKIVKEDLGINVNLYSNKHAGANAKILAGMSIDALRELFGHTSKLTTQIYATKIKEIHRNEILEKSPEY